VRIGILASHPIQYQSPIFRDLAKRLDLIVYFSQEFTKGQHAASGFLVDFEWDTDLLDGYNYKFLANYARRPGTNHFFGARCPEVYDEITREKFDAFIVLGWHLFAYWQAVFACKRTGTPVFVRGDSHLNTPRNRIKQIFKSVVYPKLLKSFDGHFYVGEHNRQYLRHYGVPVERMFFAPHCVDTEDFGRVVSHEARTLCRTRYGIPVDDLVVVFVGKLIDVKRPYDILDALSILRSDGLATSAVFVGDGVLKQTLQTRALSEGLPVFFLGFRNQSEIHSIYRCADMLVLPSSSETWGLVVNEALASNVPVVVSDVVGCCPDLVTNRPVGCVFSVGDVQSLARAIQMQLLNQPTESDFNEVNEKYSVRACVDGILAGLDAIVFRRKKGKSC
jgi:glycosyltransferase involved in cell wall biosynthesis